MTMFHNVIRSMRLPRPEPRIRAYRPPFGRPYRCVGLTISTPGREYGVIAHDDGHTTYEIDHHPVPRLPDDDLSGRLLQAYSRHRAAVVEYLRTQAYEVWHNLSTHVEESS